VCMRIFKLMDFRRASSPTVSTRVARHSGKSSLPWTELSRTQTAICSMRGAEIWRNLSSRQKAESSQVVFNSVNTKVECNGPPSSKLNAFDITLIRAFQSVSFVAWFPEKALSRSWMGARRNDMYDVIKPWAMK
jgi:hypothetical protein